MFVKFELKNKILNSVVKSNYVMTSHKHLALYRLSSLPRSSSISRVVNRCIYTGRKYSTIKRYQLSRFAIRLNSNEGLLPGMRRHS